MSGRALDTAAALVITVRGRPAPQGSKLRTRFGLIDDNTKTLKPWRRAVTLAAVAAKPDGYCLTGPVIVEATVTLPRPAAHFRTGRFAHLLRDDAPGWPIGRGTGDSDKYARAINDALTDAAVWIDDAQAVETVCRKVYVDGGLDALDTPGAVIRLWSVAS